VGQGHQDFLNYLSISIAGDHVLAQLAATLQIHELLGSQDVAIGAGHPTKRDDAKQKVSEIDVMWHSRITYVRTSCLASRLKRADICMISV
jgi:hypothetical protein